MDTVRACSCAVALHLHVEAVTFASMSLQQCPLRRTFALSCAKRLSPNGVGRGSQIRKEVLTAPDRVTRCFWPVQPNGHWWACRGAPRLGAAVTVVRARRCSGLPPAPHPPRGVGGTGPCARRAAGAQGALAGGPLTSPLPLVAATDCVATGGARAPRRFAARPRSTRSAVARHLPLCARRPRAPVRAAPFPPQPRTRAAPPPLARPPPAALPCHSA